MAVSKKRKKKGKAVKHDPTFKPLSSNRAADQLSGVTLQELINVLAYQEYVESGDIVPTPNVDFEDPDAQAVIRAVASNKNESPIDPETTGVEEYKIIEENDE